MSEIDDYISGFPPETRVRLVRMRELIRSAAPEAAEKISYGMPTFYLNGNLVHFAGYKGHVGFYPAPSGIARCPERIAEYKHAKGSVQFPLDKPLPESLINDIVEFRRGENLNKVKKK